MTITIDVGRSPTRGSSMLLETPFLAAPAAASELEPGWDRRASSASIASPLQRALDVPQLELERQPAEAVVDESFEEQFSPADVPANVTEALTNRAWALALTRAMEAGWHDENELTNLLFFARHPDLPQQSLDPTTTPNFKQLTTEWTRILQREVRPAIQSFSRDDSLGVSGAYVAERDPSFSGKIGVGFKDLVAWAAHEVDLNPGFLAAVLLAEWDKRALYLQSGPVASYQAGSDDYYESRARIRASVPAAANVHFDPHRIFTNTNEHGRRVTTILYDSGRDAILSMAAYLKWAENRMRPVAQKRGKDFDALSVEVRFALTRMAIAAGHGGITDDGDMVRFKRRNNGWVRVAPGEQGGVLIGVCPMLDAALQDKDFFIRTGARRDASTDVRALIRNATILAAQAIHLSEWIFGLPLRPRGQPQPEAPDYLAELGETELSDEYTDFESTSFEVDEFESDAPVELAAEVDPELVADLEHPDHEWSESGPATEMLVPTVDIASLRTRLDEYFDLANAMYTLPSGTVVRARPQFRYAKGGGVAEAIARTSRRLGQSFEQSHPRTIHMAAYGRAKPDELAAITQALIDAGEVALVSAAFPADSNAQLVRRIQSKFGMGIDCAGYVQLAFIHAFTGSDNDSADIRKKLGLHPKRGWERLTALPREHFAEVGIDDTRTGDLVVMKPRPKSADQTWHTVIVVDHTTTGTEHTYLVDASWGTDMYGRDAGGVARRRLKRDAATGEWWDIDPVTEMEAHRNSDGPYSGHPIHGVFRARPST